MSASTTEKPADLRVPPEEQFWKRYSPHGEAPLSLAGSVATHLLVAGGMVLFGLYLYALFNKDHSSIPVEPVRLDLGGGGGKRGGVGDDKGVGSGQEEDVDGKDDITQPLTKDDAPKRPVLTPAETQKLEQNYNPEDLQPITKTESGKAFARLDEGIRKKLADGIVPGKGEGGPGKGGGSGSGSGGGTGVGSGTGKATLNDREKRMLRWHMRFTANTGPEYVAQLKALGAILAFPIGGDRYQVVRDLVPPAKLLDEDLSQIQRIYWIDDKPNSVLDVLKALRINLPGVPPRFIAFMPKELEDKLFEMEKSYVTKVLRRKFDENKIEETNFRVEFVRGKYKPELVSVSMKP